MEAFGTNWLNVMFAALPSHIESPRQHHRPGMPCYRLHSNTHRRLADYSVIETAVAGYTIKDGNQDWRRQALMLSREKLAARLDGSYWTGGPLHRSSQWRILPTALVGA